MTYIRKNEKDENDIDIINKIKLSMRILELLYQIIEKMKSRYVDKHLNVSDNVNFRAEEKSLHLLQFVNDISMP